jgi:hypothetical protein
VCDNGTRFLNESLLIQRLNQKTLLSESKIHQNLFRGFKSQRKNYVINRKKPEKKQTEGILEAVHRRAQIP